MPTIESQPNSPVPAWVSCPRRAATAAEIIAHGDRLGRVSFRHFVLETYSPRARNGVQHRQYSRSKIYAVDGKPHVKHHGKLAEVTADILTIDGRDIVSDVRIKSEYLP